MTARVLLGVCIATASATALGAVSQQPAAPDLSVKISTPIYLANGKTAGGSGMVTLHQNQPTVAYPNGGSVFCGPADAAGWRVEITPVSKDTATVLNVNWQHVSLAAANLGQQLVDQQVALTAVEGRASSSARDLMDLMLARRTVRDTEAQLAPLIKLSSRGVAQVTLQPGDRVVLDYISTSVRTISPNMATEVAYVTGRPACDVVGMGLEISIESAPKAPTIVESELWLIHTRPDKTEETQHQTLRVRAGDSAMYWFDDVAVLLPATPFAGGELKPIRVAEVPIQVSGRLSPVDLGDGKIHMKLTIARSGQSAHTRIASPNVAAVTLGPPTGSTTYDLTAEPGEVLSFQLPPIRTPAGTADGAFSVRLRARTLGLSLVAPEGAQAPAQAGTMSDAHQALLTEALLFPGVAEVLKVTVVASGVPSPPAPTQHLSPSYRPPGTPAPALDMSTVVEPKLLSKVDPIYPPSAIADGVQGTSIGEAIIDHEGRVIEARIIDGGVARLDQATLDAIKQWRYSPMKQGGVAKAILINFRIIYALR